MKASEIMHAKVVTVTSDTRLADVAALMVEHGVDALPVVDDGRFVGLVRATDFLRLLLPNAVRFLDVNLYVGAGRLHAALVRESGGLRAGDIVKRPLPTVGAHAPLDEVVGLMGEHDVHHVPVVDDGQLVGIVYRLDVVRLFTDWMEREDVDT